MWIEQNINAALQRSKTSEQKSGLPDIAPKRTCPPQEQIGRGVMKFVLATVNREPSVSLRDHRSPSSLFSPSEQNIRVGGKNGNHHRMTAIVRGISVVEQTGLLLHRPLQPLDPPQNLNQHQQRRHRIRRLHVSWIDAVIDNRLQKRGILNRRLLRRKR